MERLRHSHLMVDFSAVRASQRSKATGNEYKNIQIYGSPELQARKRALVKECKFIFRSPITSSPADLISLKLEVDLENGKSRPIGQKHDLFTDSYVLPH
jgi:hypothetical protein